MTTTILFFQSPTCSPCHVITDEVGRAADAHGITVIPVDVSDEKKAGICRRFQVYGGLPILAVVRDGQQVGRIEGTYAKPGKVGKEIAKFSEVAQ